MAGFGDGRTQGGLGGGGMQVFEISAALSSTAAAPEQV